jgi:hypothetical protein
MRFAAIVPCGRHPRVSAEDLLVSLGDTVRKSSVAQR